MKVNIVYGILYFVHEVPSILDPCNQESNEPI